jgi:hypothetical protein
MSAAASDPLRMDADERLEAPLLKVGQRAQAHTGQSDLSYCAPHGEGRSQVPPDHVPSPIRWNLYVYDRRRKECSWVRTRPATAGTCLRGRHVAISGTVCGTGGLVTV